MHCIAPNTPTTQIVYLKLEPKEEKEGERHTKCHCYFGRTFFFFLFSFSLQLHCFSFLFSSSSSGSFPIIFMSRLSSVCVFLFIIFRLNLWLVFLRVVWPCHVCCMRFFLRSHSLSPSLSLFLLFSLIVYAFSVLQLIASFYLRAFGKLKRPRKTKPKRNEYFYSIWRHKLPLTLSLGSRRPFWSFSKERTYRSPPHTPLK